MPKVRYRWIDKTSQLNVGSKFFKVGELVPHEQLGQSRLDFFVEQGQATREEIPLAHELPPKPPPPEPEPEPEPEPPKRGPGRPRKKKGRR